MFTVNGTKKELPGVFSVKERKGYARIAISQPLKYALRNEVLKYNGLVSLLDQYQLKHI